MKFHLLLIIMSLFFTASINAELVIGKPLPNFVLEGDDGGNLDGSKWTLEQSLAEKKITVIFYVDPDEKDLNEEISERLKKENFSLEKVQYVAIINMAATWLPNFAISESLKQKQKKYPDSLYLKDYTKAGLKAWPIHDDQNNFILLDQQGKVLFYKFGKVNKEEQEVVVKKIKALLN